MKKISIITICFNDSVGILKTFESVFSQTHKEFEYIVIDGGSLDGSVEIIKNNSCLINFWVSEPDNGIYHAMNKGISKATGEYLLFLNSGDTFASENILQEISSFINDADIIYGDLLIKEHNDQWVKTYPDKLTFSHFYRDSLPHPCSFIKRSLFNLVGFYNENNKIVSDWEFFIIAVNKFNCSYKHIPFTISVFITDGISSSIANQELVLQEKGTALIKHFPHFVDDYNEFFLLKEEIGALKKSKALKIAGLIKKYI